MSNIQNMSLEDIMGLALVATQYIIQERALPDIRGEACSAPYSLFDDEQGR